MEIAKRMGIPEKQALELINYSKVPPQKLKEEAKLKARQEKYNLILKK